MVDTWSGLALWLSPSSASYPTFEALIEQLAESHSTPSFSPHVTLLSGMPTSSDAGELLSKLRQAVDEWIKVGSPTSPKAGLELQFGGLGTNAAEENFFQYLFAEVNLSEPLASLRRTVRAALLPSLDATTDSFFPHLSLMYGLDTDARKARDIIKVLEGQGGGKERWPQEIESIVAEEILLVRCEGKPEEWKVLGSVSLKC